MRDKIPFADYVIRSIELDGFSYQQGLWTSLKEVLSFRGTPYNPGCNSWFISGLFRIKLYRYNPTVNYYVRIKLSKEQKKKINLAMKQYWVEEKTARDFKKNKIKQSMINSQWWP